MDMDSRGCSSFRNSLDALDVCAFELGPESRRAACACSHFNPDTDDSGRAEATGGGMGTIQGSR